MDDNISREIQKESASIPPQTNDKQSEVKSRVDAVWEQMNKGISAKTLNSIVNKRASTVNASVQKIEASHNWMSLLGMSPKKAETNGVCQGNNTTSEPNGISEEAKTLAAASVAARGKIEVTEKRDLAGEEIEVKKFVEASSMEATEKAGPSSAVDAILEQIKKKPKLNLLDKTKKDWGEFKEENEGLVNELDAYKKSSNQYLDKVSFLNRADYREFERERDVRLAQQAKRRLELREAP